MEENSVLKSDTYVSGDGPFPCSIMFVGEAPGKDEVREGKPFVGKAGSILKGILTRLNIERKDIYVTNTVKFRLAKPGKREGTLANRPAEKKDIEACIHILKEEIKSVNPLFIVSLGNVPLKAILSLSDKCENKYTVGEVHGNIISLNFEGIDRIVRLIPLYHPASIIYNRSLESEYEKDIEKLKKILEEDLNEKV